MDNCIEWSKSVDAGGYGRAWHQGKVVKAHRLAYCNAHNINLSDIDGLVIRHTCDNPLCVNPAHLIAGETKDNVRDRQERNRTSRGEGRHNCKLFEDEVNWLRSVYTPYDREWGTSALARKIGISQRTIHAAISRTNWKHLGGVQ